MEAMISVTTSLLTITGYHEIDAPMGSTKIPIPSFNLAINVSFNILTA